MWPSGHGLDAPGVDGVILSLCGFSSRALQVWGFKEEMILNRLVVGLMDVALSERLQMDPNLTLQKTIGSARNLELL